MRISDWSADVCSSDLHLRQFHRIARLHVGLLARDDRVADTQPLRRQDIGLRPVLIFDERDERGAVRVIFHTLDGGRHVTLATLEVDEAVLLLVAAGDAARGHMTLVVAASALALAFGHPLDGLALPQPRLFAQDTAPLP